MILLDNVRQGSSPLARGLPPTTGQAMRLALDHPRSRGVYEKLDINKLSASGSSPLARGLLLSQVQLKPATGIIPARAGFTPKEGISRHADGDHPRSRGVYLVSRLRVIHGLGSSSLARGLLDGVTEVHHTVRIIPARAGFTWLSPSVPQQALDHPRSRGVYVPWWIHLRRPSGSSPLARGLLEPLLSVRAKNGIIPARAGFTSVRAAPAAYGQDHPRSRGVYRRSSRRFPGPPGSSPLARGLRCNVRRRARDGGIIPARAGFTRALAHPPGQSPDHPRSRGVYSSSTMNDSPTPGSSPLARGLRQSRYNNMRAVGIIPARAGFTSVPLQQHEGGRDHPRSRGVYMLETAPAPAFWGSSPLARGLLPLTNTNGDRVRIIPARAGFT